MPSLEAETCERRVSLWLSRWFQTQTPAPLRLQAKKAMQKGSGQRLGEAKRRRENKNEKEAESSTTVDKSKEQTIVRAGTLVGSSVQMLFLL